MKIRLKPSDLPVVVVTLITILCYGCGRPAKPLDPPEVVAKRLDESKPKEQRVEAAKDLLRHGEDARPQIREAIEQHAGDEPAVVAPLVQAAMRAEDYQSLPKLIVLMDHDNPRVRGRAGAAVQRLMGADYGFRAKLNRTERTRIISQIKSEYAMLKDRLPEVYGH